MAGAPEAAPCAEARGDALGAGVGGLHRLLITINILPLLFIDFEQKLQNQYFHTNLFFVFFF